MSLVVENIYYAYSHGKEVINHVSLEIGDGELVALKGPSGCGKSTLLHCISGLLTPSSGVVSIDGRDVSKCNSHERGVGIMMQDQPLYEHLTVEQNIAFPLRARGEKKTCVLQTLEQLCLTDIAEQKVSKCSGGERRRVAFGRATVIQPKVLLLDEPFVSLNEELSDSMRVLIQSIGVTTLLVTHETNSLPVSFSLSFDNL